MNTDIQNIVKKIARLWKRLTTHTLGEVHPERDWVVLLVLSLLLFFISIGVNGVLFYRVYNGTALAGNKTENTVSKQTEKINKEVEEIQKIFDARKEQYDKFISEPYSFVDPAR